MNYYVTLTSRKSLNFKTLITDCNVTVKYTVIIMHNYDKFRGNKCGIEALSFVNVFELPTFKL